MLDALRNPPRGERNLAAIARQLGPAYPALAEALARHLPAAADPDLALNNLERWLATPASRPHWPALADPASRLLEGLLQLLGTSQFFADTLVAYPEAFDMVQPRARPTPSTAELTQTLRAEVEAARDDAGVLRAFRRFRQVQMLRVGAGDLLLERPLEEVTRELSRLADASVEVALQAALRASARRFGPPLTPRGEPARVVALAFGKLGGDELNYSSDIDLMFVHDHDGETAGKQAGAITNADYFNRVVAEVVRLLSTITDRGFCYRVDLRLRPDGQRGALSRSMAGVLSYYDVRGRTWERQALIKLRPVAGDLALGREFLRAIEPFVYRKYFSFSEINEIKALKRRMEQRTTQAGADDLDVKTGRGGIRDIEYTVQFLQLLNGGDLPAVRQRNTLLGLEALEIAGCLTGHETYTLADAYRFLRKTEHRLQVLFDWQTHKLPATAEGLDRLARRMGYAPKVPPRPDDARPSAAIPPAPHRRPLLDEPPSAILSTRPLLVEPMDQFLKDYHDKTGLDRAILDHLLHQTFPEPERTGAGPDAEPESDLILAPDPDEATVRTVLGRYPFREPLKAHQNLMRLAQEEVPFLSHRRCRHFLASIAPRLLRALADTPDPDFALANLERVTASLGGKAVLYELFSFNPPSLKLYVDICAVAQYLASILINNPGMIDELLDTLVLDQPRAPEELREELTQLCAGASDLDPILHSFQDKELLRIGVRDLLGKDTIQQTTAALSDLAETLLNGVFDRAEAELAAKHGPPMAGAERCRYAVLGLGKLGGREISFYSDLDLVILYEADGTTAGGTAAATTNFHYFTDLAQHATRMLSQAGPLGRLYSVDLRLRPTGKSASLVVPLAEFRRYYGAEGGARLWERQALTRARVVRGAPEFAAAVGESVRAAVLARPWRPEFAAEIARMREKLDGAGGPRHIKRGPGGLIDVEFLVQLWQLRHGRAHPEVLEPNVWRALDALEAAGVVDAPTVVTLREGYTFLRSVETRLRVATDRASGEFPEGAAERQRLARRMGQDAGVLQARLAAAMAAQRCVFKAAMAREQGG